MEFHIVREAFFKLLNRLQTVAERRNTMPILGYTLIEATPEGITLSATDLDISVRTTGPAEVVIPGAVAVLAKRLYDVIRELPGEATIRLRLDELTNRVTLTSGRSRFVLAGMPSNEFPALQQADGEEEVVFPAATLSMLLAKTSFAMSTDDTRFTLSGTLFQVVAPSETREGGLIRMVATDTHRLALVEHPLVEGTLPPLEVILPRKAVQELRKLVDEDSADLHLALSKRFIQATKPEVTLISKLVEGRYPNYQRVIPANHPHRLTVDKEELKSAVRRMAVISNEKSQGVLLEITEALLKINSDNPEQDVGEEEFAVSYQGPRVIIGFNARYLLEILSACDGERVTMMFLNDEDPVIVSDPDNQNLLYVLMPIRL